MSEGDLYRYILEGVDPENPSAMPKEMLPKDHELNEVSAVPDKQWKAAERHIGRLLGGTRVPVNGRGGAPDVEHPILAIEVKYRGSVPAWLSDALSQARGGATEGKLPVTVLHAGGDLYADALVVCRLGDFAEALARGKIRGDDAA